MGENNKNKILRIEIYWNQKEVAAGKWLRLNTVMTARKHLLNVYGWILFLYSDIYYFRVSSLKNFEAKYRIAAHS